MANVDISKPPYYGDYDRDNLYSLLLFQPNRPLQARELNVLEQTLRADINNLGDAFFKEGDIISGLDFDLKKDTAKK